ncbi:hypothetical protein [Okeania sp. KiyG1]|uniref:hypothetical protein n=1 Tax=Okeania sp. KiyG1 TaxID=2720165 RepID=UPI001923DE43|nr:hypothetical protein [Okeania sp. KiyG1]
MSIKTFERSIEPLIGSRKVAMAGKHIVEKPSPVIPFRKAAKKNDKNMETIVWRFICHIISNPFNSARKKCSIFNDYQIFLHIPLLGGVRVGSHPPIPHPPISPSNYTDATGFDIKCR